MEIVPAILEEEYGDIEALAESVSEAKKIHIDICDGKFVNSKTWPYTYLSSNNLDQDLYVHQLLTEEIGLPRWEEVDYHFDLMIEDPAKTLDTWTRLGGSTIILHPTSSPKIEDFLSTIEAARGILSDVGIAFTYDEWMIHKDLAETWLADSWTVQILQCMSIRHIGVQGEPFDARWFDIIPDIKNKYPNLIIQMDGGIHLENIASIKADGVDRIIVGSGIFGEGNASDNLEEFKSRAAQQ